MKCVCFVVQPSHPPSSEPFQSCSTNTINHQLPIPPALPPQPLDTPILFVTLETTLGRTLVPKSLSSSQQPFPWVPALL